MSDLAVVGVVVLAFGFVGWKLWGLVARLRHERAKQAPAGRTPLWQLFAVAAVIGVTGVSAGINGWGMSDLALAGVVIASVVQYLRSRRNAG